MKQTDKTTQLMSEVLASLDSLPKYKVTPMDCSCCNLQLNYELDNQQDTWIHSSDLDTILVKIKESISSTNT